MDAKTRRGVETRWLYRQEATTFRFNGYANQLRGMKWLRALAARVWQAEAPAGRRFPDIQSGPGVRSGGAAQSYCEGFTKIVLTRGQQNVLILLHELTHALGPCVHGPKFVRLYFRLLRRYGGYNRWFLESVAAERGIAL